MEQFLLVNTSRGRHTRTARATNPTHKGLAQKLDNGVRVLRGRPTPVGLETLKKILPDVLRRELVGILEVRSMDGRRVRFKEDGSFSVDPAPKSPPIPFASDGGMKVDLIGKEQMEHFDAKSIGEEADITGDLDLPKPAIASREKIVDEDLDELKLPPAHGSDTMPATSQEDEDSAEAFEAEAEESEEAEEEEPEQPAEQEKPDPARARSTKRQSRKARRRSS